MLKMRMVTVSRVEVVNARIRKECIMARAINGEEKTVLCVNVYRGQLK